MELSIYEFDNYKGYLNSWLEAQPKRGHGLRKKMAEAIGTQTGFVTQVLSGTAHFSAEQLLPVSKFIGHSTDELQFFLLLLQHERAGTAEYRRHVFSQMDKIRKERQILAKRLKAASFPSDVDQSLYFSSWIYACIHVMTTCQRYQESRQSIAAALGLPPETVASAIEFLIRTGLVKENKGRLETGEARVHLGTDSPYLVRHHSNWNLLAVQKILSGSIDRDLHYSSVVSLSEADIAKVREVFTKALEKSKGIIRDSEGEKVFVTTLNFMEIC